MDSDARKAASSGEITQLLIRWTAGDQPALDQLIPLVYEELRRMAARYMRKENRGHTLQATALVNEAFVKLVDQRHVNWQNRAHFFGISAQLMRRILIDHARAHASAKKGGDFVFTSLDEAAIISSKRADEFLFLDDALNKLAEMDPQKSRIVEMRFFGGLTTEEIAEVEMVSSRTIEREWRKAKAWLYREIRDTHES